MAPNDSDLSVYFPSEDVKESVNRFPVILRLQACPFVRMFPFRPLANPHAGNDALPASSTVTAHSDPLVEDPHRYATRLIRGPGLYARNRIEYGFTAWHTASNTLISILQLGSHVCGHDGIVHGGLLGAYFDDVMSALLMLAFEGEGLKGVTARLDVRFTRAIRAPAVVAFVVWIERVVMRKVELKGAVHSVLTHAEEQERGAKCAGMASENDKNEQFRVDEWLGTGTIKYAEANALFVTMSTEKYNKWKL
ncbi:HotDog domain-containing protein [Chytriomyces sp. MP71]|nr:HotDog domain-containing protein [Chytriomyces sp. MP71]